MSWYMWYMYIYIYLYIYIFQKEWVKSKDQSTFTSANILAYSKREMYTSRSNKFDSSTSLITYTYQILSELCGSKILVDHSFWPTYFHLCLHWFDTYYFKRFSHLELQKLHLAANRGKPERPVGFSIKISGILFRCPARHSATCRLRETGRHEGRARWAFCKLT